MTDPPASVPAEQGATTGALPPSCHNRNTLWEEVKNVTERAVNSAYGTDPRHGLLARAVADDVAFEKPLPWNLGKHFGRTAPAAEQGATVGLTEAEREALWEAIERAYLDTTTYSRDSEVGIERAVEAILTARLAAVEEERDAAMERSAFLLKAQQERAQEVADLKARLAAERADVWEAGFFRASDLLGTGFESDHVDRMNPHRLTRGDGAT